ncbi:helix-turn-helix domain-containing protein [Sphingopyxis sp. R3-92]|uniref:AraC family transcriptional regulator n=1 Tax=Sphingopyxis sp. R3-92 TaxID=3158553 RepID=UPI003EE5E29B
MPLQDILDLMIRGAATALFGLWIAILWRDYRNILSARVAIAMNFAIISYLLAPAFRPDYPLTFPFVLFDALSLAVPALFWLFARLWFDDRQCIDWIDGLLMVGFAVLLLAQVAAIVTTGWFSWEIMLMVRITMLGFALGGIWIAWRGRAADLIEERRSFRLAVVGAIGGFIMWIIFLEMFPSRDMNHDLRQLVTLPAIVIATFIVSVGLYRFRSAELFAAPGAPPPREEAQPAAPSGLARRLQAVMAEERAYRAEGFSIAALAAQLGEPEYRVRRAINGEMGFRNFTAFLNGFRLEEVRAALADPAQQGVPILTIAIDAGFGSLGPFNRAFRDAEGMTPSEYRAARLGLRD